MCVFFPFLWEGEENGLLTTVLTSPHGGSHLSPMKHQLTSASPGSTELDVNGGQESPGL